MTNVEKLTQIGIIGDVRQRFGADDENDSQMDDAINKRDNSQLIAAWAGWHLGDGSWWKTMKAYYDGLEEYCPCGGKIKPTNITGDMQCEICDQNF